MTAGLILAAYTLEASRDELAGSEQEWYDLLAGIEGGVGLEVPYRDGLHPAGTARLAELLPAGWSVVVTMIPATVAALRGSAEYGLASPDAEGRTAALAALTAVRDDIRRLNDATGATTVRSVQLHSAPRNGNAAAFADSMLTVAAEDWSGATLVVEHCDVWRPDGAVEKGFLSLEDEIAAVRELPNVGQSINWGRSVIEGRTVDRAAEHIALLAEANTLTGVFFSGASAAGGPLGAPWKDVHNPLDTVDPTSLLTRSEIARAVNAFGASAPDFIGVKVAHPAPVSAFSEHLEALRVTAAAVREALG
jgi:hypothetical protein